nr:hypothetical protein [uncultured Caproiciproducens sp.]
MLTMAPACECGRHIITVTLRRQNYGIRNSHGSSGGDGNGNTCTDARANKSLNTFQQSLPSTVLLYTMKIVQSLSI